MNDDVHKQIIYALRKPTKCPKCSSKRVVKIIYGEPTHEAWLRYQEGKIALGGCCVREGQPVWQCLECKIEISKKESTQPHADIDDDLPF